MYRRIVAACMLVAGLMLAGCSQDERLAEFAQQATHEQAQQNERVAEANRLVAESHERLIEADARSRTELVALQQDLRSDQAEVGRLRDELEVERREIVDERRTDSATGSGLVALAVMIACLSPLLLGAAALFGLFTEPKDTEISFVLADELARTQHEMLPSAPSTAALTQEPVGQTPRLS